MQSHSAADTVYSATYVDDYMDYVENLPQEIQYYVTKVHELDLLYRGYLKDVKLYKDILAKDDIEVNIQKKTLYKLEQIFISLQEVGDEKVEIGQVINDLIDNKFRNVDQDLKSLDYYRENDSEPIKEISRDVIASKDTCVLSTSSSTIEKNGSNQGNERASKRSRRARNETEALDSPIMETRTTSLTKLSSGTVSGGISSAISTNSGSGIIAKTSGAAAAKKKKRKTRQREETPPKEEELVHEIDEPTYCLCDQISYGEMIMCDNDLCPIEWFHFLCVSLSTKPKGKWFCPMCRGDRPNIMKPKPQFLKELERYNKEKEEKA